MQRKVKLTLLVLLVATTLSACGGNRPTGTTGGGVWGQSNWGQATWN